MELNGYCQVLVCITFSMHRTVCTYVCVCVRMFVRMSYEGISDFCALLEVQVLKLVELATVNYSREEPLLADSLHTYVRTCMCVQ